MNWIELKDKIYNWDGSWRDIYVLNAKRSDWERWVNYVNENYRVDWYNGKVEKDETKIDFSVVTEFWGGNDDLSSTARVFLGKIQINAHFFDDGYNGDADPSNGHIDPLNGFGSAKLIA